MAASVSTKAVSSPSYHLPQQKSSLSSLAFLITCLPLQFSFGFPSLSQQVSAAVLTSRAPPSLMPFYFFLFNSAQPGWIVTQGSWQHHPPTPINHFFQKCTPDIPHSSPLNQKHPVSLHKATTLFSFKTPLKTFLHWNKYRKIANFDL